MSFGRSTSRTKADIIGPEQQMTKQQRELLGIAGPTLLDQALRGGFSPSERSSLYRRSVENINRATRSSQESLRDISARTGITGGKFAGDFSDILEAGIQAKGQASTDIEAQSRDESARRWQRLLSLATYTPGAFAAGGKKTGQQFGIGGRDVAAGVLGVKSLL